MKNPARKLLVLIGLLVFIGIYSVLRPAPALAQSVPCPMPPDVCTAIDSFFQTQADGPWYSQNNQQFSKKVLGDPPGSNDSEIFGERYTYAQINWIINSIATMLNPAANIHSAADLFNFINSIKSILHTSRPTIQDYAKLGPAGLFTGGISALYANPPASGISEIKYMASRLFDTGTGVQPAYAQGYGYNGLNTRGGVRSLWSATRNMAYLVMTILLVASGFLIMFRVKINPQTIVSLQTMIPKLVITMLLVTFSFAIAGLVIDLIYVFIVAFVGMLSLSGNSIITNPTGLITILTTSNYGMYIAAQTLGAFIFLITVTLVAIGVALVPAATMPAFIVTVIIVIIVAVYYFYILFKIFWMLIKSYVMLILQICIGPLQIMLDLIPGQQGFGPWIRNLIANASVFVVVPVLLVIQKILSWDPLTNAILGINDFGTMGGVNIGLPFLGGNALDMWSLLIRVGIGFVILSITPKVADMIRDALKIPAFKYGSAVGEAFGPVRKIAGTGVDALYQRQVVDTHLGSWYDPTGNKPVQWQGRVAETIASSLKGAVQGH